MCARYRRYMPHDDWQAQHHFIILHLNLFFFLITKNHTHNPHICNWGIGAVTLELKEHGLKTTEQRVITFQAHRQIWEWDESMGLSIQTL